MAKRNNAVECAECLALDDWCEACEDIGMAEAENYASALRAEFLWKANALYPNEVPHL